MRRWRFEAGEWPGGPGIATCAACAVLLLGVVVMAGDRAAPGDNAVPGHVLKGPAARPAAEEPATPGAIRAKSQASTLESIGGKAEEMTALIRSFQASIQQAGWDGGMQERALGELRAAVGGLWQDHKVFQARNQAANLPEGDKVSRDLQQRLDQVGTSLNSLAGARDADAAHAALSRISITLAGISTTIETLPPCCTEGTCCHVEFR